MDQVDIAGLGFPCSRFVFGTASLFNAGDARARRALLDAAVDHGFTHFDAAPLYGFGIAERDLASILKAHPEVTVTTKVGLYPPGGCQQSSAAVWLRKAAGKVCKTLARPVKTFDLAKAQASLEGSLRRLARDRIDLYLLHEPSVDVMDAAAWLAWLDQEKQKGRIRQFGLALPPASPEPLLADSMAIGPVLQISDSLDRCEADVASRHGRPLQITYGYLSAARRRGDRRSAEEILRQALVRNSQGAIIVSTRRKDRLVQYARASEAAS